MARLPNPGSDSGMWGDILNNFLMQAHNSDGTIKDTGIVGSKAPLANPTFTGHVTVPTPTSATDAVTKQYVDDIASAGAPDATTGTKGIVQLTGDLGGTAASPTVPELSNKADKATTISAGTGLTGGGDLSADRTLNVSDNSTTQKIEIAKAGSITGTRKQLNLIEGANVTITTSDNGGSDRVDVTIASAMGGDVSGPGSATADGVVLFNGTTGKSLKDSSKTLPTGAIVGTTDNQALTNKTLTSPVINSPTGITKTDVGLANVDNTSDADKPVSTATQTALDAKVDDSQIDTDITFGANSNTRVASQKATKTYVDNQVGQANVPFLSIDQLTVAMTHSDLVASGMTYYPDGTMGFADSGGGAIVGVTSNGAYVATVIHNPATGGIAAVIDNDGTIQDVIDGDLDYYSGGPVFAPNAYGLSADIGSLLMLHAEKHDLPNFWSGVGMAKFDVNDQQWYDLGLVVTPNYTFPGTLTNSLDVGSGNFAFDDEWYYVFFKDSSDGVSITHLSIARAPLADVIEAATNNGPVPVFTKYSGGSWSSAGVGGAKADDLLPNLGGYLIWQDIIKVDDYGGWALAYTRNLQSDDTPVDTVEVIWSKDLIHWSAPQTIVAPDPNNERFYITLTSPLENEPYSAKVVKSGDPIDLYVVKSDISDSPAERWNTSSVERYRLSVNSSTTILGGAVQKTDTSTADMDFVIDEDNMASNSATKVPTQQSVKAYVDNKTTGVGNVNGPSSATANAVAVFDGTTGKLLKDSTKTLPTSTIVGVDDAQVLTNKTFTDSTFFLQDETDNTKKAQFQLSSIGGTRTYTLQNASGTIYISGGNDVSVADGGTGRSTSTTAYGLIAAGTTATGAQQTISPGTSGHILKSNGASALPSFSAGTASDVGLGNVTNDAQLKASDLIDEDNMASNSATKVPSQQSVKAYVDAIDSEHQVGGSGQPAFQNSWGASMGGLEFATFYKDRHRVYFDALMTGGSTGTVAFTLPAGYRPSSTKTMPAASSDGVGSMFAAITVNTDGTVVPGFDPSFPVVSANISFRV